MAALLACSENPTLLPSDAATSEIDPIGTADIDTDKNIHIDSDTMSDTAPHEDTVAIVFTVESHLASEETPSAPGTVGIVNWSLEGGVAEKAEIHFGLDSTTDMVAPVDLSEPGYRTLLLGMKPNRAYTFRIVATIGETAFSSEDYSLTTGPSTNLVSVSTTVLHPDAHQPGFIVTNQRASIETAVAYIMDRDGDVVWWYQSGIGQAARARMSYDGKHMWLVPNRGDYDSAPLQRVTMDTLETEFFEVGATHDATPVDSQTIAYIDYGEGDCGSVFELDNAGNTVEIFESTDYLPGLSAPDCHLNAVRYNEAEGLYTISDRANDIFVVDRQGNLEWRLSDTVSNTSYGREQHGHQWLTDSLVLFANVGGEEDNSAVIEFDLSTGEEILCYDPGVFSVWLGDVQRLPGGNTLVTFSIAGVIHEIDGQGNRVMEVNSIETLGYASWRPTLYGPPTDVQM